MASPTNFFEGLILIKIINNNLSKRDEGEQTNKQMGIGEELKEFVEMLRGWHIQRKSKKTSVGFSAEYMRILELRKTMYLLNRHK